MRLSSSTLSGVLVIPMSLPKNPNDNREMLTSTMAVVLIKIFLYVSHLKKREKFVKKAMITYHKVWGEDYISKLHFLSQKKKKMIYIYIYTH